jgi:uncharacterized cupredoxin-like copper-binding protein
MRKRPLFLAGILVAALAGAAAAGVQAGASAKTITVTAREYHIALSATKASGAVTLVVRNVGKLSHQIEIKGPGVTKKTPLLKPGTKATLHVTLKAGKYALWCTVPGHAALGMKATLTGTGGTTSGGSTTTTGGGGGNAWG